MSLQLRVVHDIKKLWLPVACSFKCKVRKHIHKHPLRNITDELPHSMGHCFNLDTCCGILNVPKSTQPKYSRTLWALTHLIVSGWVNMQLHSMWPCLPPLWLFWVVARPTKHRADCGNCFKDTAALHNSPVWTLQGWLMHRLPVQSNTLLEILLFISFFKYSIAVQCPLTQIIPRHISPDLQIYQKSTFVAVSFIRVWDWVYRQRNKISSVYWKVLNMTSSQAKMIN